MPCYCMLWTSRRKVFLLLQSQLYCLMIAAPGNMTYRLSNKIGFSNMTLVITKEAQCDIFPLWPRTLSNAMIGSLDHRGTTCQRCFPPSLYPGLYQDRQLSWIDETLMPPPNARHPGKPSILNWRLVWNGSKEQEREGPVGYRSLDHCTIARMLLLHRGEVKYWAEVVYRFLCDRYNY